MKTIITLFSTILFMSCSGNKSISQKDTVANLVSDCPKDGTCVLEVYNNKNITVKQDEFGSVYYSIDDNLNTKVYKYIYSRTVKGDLQDAGYREEIVFELNNDNTIQTFFNNELQSTKMLFGRFCFCRGQTGNYKVTDGKLESTENKITLKFNVSQVPQIIKNLTIDLK